MPDFSLEDACRATSAAPAVVCGVDEAGRGPLAGPVVAGATVLDPARLPAALRDGLDDSKKLSAKKRDALFALLTDPATPGVHWGLGLASVAEIDSLNILRATHLAMQRAVEALSLRPTVALIDGNQMPRSFPCPVQAVIKGDGLSLSIAAASVLAKVHRDRLMLDLHAAFPVYNWAKNMGYGTAEHRTAMRTHGLSPHHRLSFGGQRELF